MDRQIRAAVGMSGGVDSSVAAWLLKEQGYDVMGVTMRLFGNEILAVQGESRCCSLDDVEDARAVARRLEIPHYVFNFGEPFRRCVMEPFAAAYERGETPNPCVECNRCLKFGAMLQRGRELNWEKIATGHYVRLEQDGGSGRWYLKRAAHREKDQSYVLWSLDQEQLEHSLFPLGGLSKDEVRQIAQEQGFVTARKGDSQDICFIPDGDYVSFLRTRGAPLREGDFVDGDGHVLGRHKGLPCYTIGQGSGLGIALGKRVYVLDKRPQDNTVVLGDNDRLFRRELTAGSVNWIAGVTPASSFRCTAKTRYSQMDTPALAEPLPDGRLRLIFDQPQRAITPGQAVVLYDDEEVLGGGTIE